jgi:hypothetical protein
MSAQNSPPKPTVKAARSPEFWGGSIPNGGCHGLRKRRLLGVYVGCATSGYVAMNTHERMLPAHLIERGVPAHSSAVRPFPCGHQLKPASGLNSGRESRASIQSADRPLPVWDGWRQDGAVARRREPR